MHEDIPAFLRLTPQQRADAWLRAPPKPMPRFADSAPRVEGADTIALRAELATQGRVKRGCELGEARGMETPTRGSSVMNEDYSRSRSLAKIEHLGRTFHVVRRKFDGKPWRSYLTLVFDGCSMTTDFARVPDASNVEQCKNYWEARIKSCFPATTQGKDQMDEAIAFCIENYKKVT